MGPTDFRILLDLDGVVADWLGHAIKTFGLNTKSEMIRQILSSDVRGLEKVIDPDFMWKVIDAGNDQWWDEIPLFPWSQYLYSEMQKLGSVCFLTQPSEHGPSAHGKTHWIQRHFKTKNSLLGAAKQFCASRYSFLIDDTPKKLNDFLNAGGNAILFPNAFRMLNTETPVDKPFAKDDFIGKAVVDSIATQIIDIQAKIRWQDKISPPSNQAGYHVIVH